MQKTVIITGAAGGIGQALCETFHAANYQVIGTDKGQSAAKNCHHFLVFDLNEVVNDPRTCEKFLKELKSKLPASGLHCLINNAAVQVKAPLEKLQPKDWQLSFNVNVIAPFLLIQGLADPLRKANGSVINISSIHSRLSKPEFSAYAASKSALDSLTRGLAMDLAGAIRVNSINPAAIDTPMLREGFAGKSATMDQLSRHHPSGRIGKAAEVARMALAMADEQLGFLNGSNVFLDGAISGRLHDPQ